MLSFAVEGCLSKLHILRENSGKGGRKIAGKRKKKQLTFVSPFVIIFVSPKERRDGMSPRTGRPTSDPKKHETRIRMSDEDIEILEYCTKMTGLTKTDVIRKGIRLVYEEIKG